MAASSPHLLDPLGRLVERVVGADASQAQRDELKVFSLRLLGSRIGANTGGDEFQLAESIKRRLAGRGESAVGGLRFAELWRRLSQRKAISNKWGILQLLSTLHDTATTRGANPKGAGCVTSQSIAALTSKEANASSSTPLPTGTGMMGMGLEETLAQKLEIRRPLLPKPASDGNGSFEIPEVHLLRDVVYAMQGIDGKYIKFDKAQDAFCVSRAHGVPSATRDLISRICETGWLYRKVSTFVKWSMEHRSVGLVAQGLAAGLQRELSEYYRLVAVLQAHVQSDADLSDSPNGDGSGKMTLRRLLVWVHEPSARLRAMSMLCDAASSPKAGAGGGSGGGLLRGGQLCTALSTLARHGDACVSSVVERVLKVACAPILKMVQRWILDGEVEDPFSEFLVECDPTAPDYNWEEKYVIRTEMIPSFLTSDLAAKVLLVGKSINFMRRCCNEVEFRGLEGSGHRDLEYGEWDALEAFVGEASTKTNGVLVGSLIERYKLKHHCEAIKKFILFGQGDFVRHLMDLLIDNVRPGALVSHHNYNLNGIVDTAIRSSAFGDDADVRERVHVCADEATAGDDVLDVFCLEYKVDTPVNCVISARATRKYKRIFHFLWRLQRVHQALNSCWHRCSSLSHVGSHYVLNKGKDRDTYLELQQFTMEILSQGGGVHARQEMQHFVTTLQYYIMFEVLECSWTQLCHDMENANDLNFLISSHDNYVESILERALLTEESEGERLKVDAVFKAILECCAVQEQLCDYADLQLERHRTLVRREEEMAAKQQWGVGEEDDDDDVLERPQLNMPLELVSRLKIRSMEFKSSFEALRDALGSTNHADLRSLNFRLDFSHFYSSRD